MSDDTDVTDHCRYHEHEVCDRWFRDICGCGCHRRPASISSPATSLSGRDTTEATDG